MARSMAWDYGDGELTSETTCFKRKYRWMFYISGVSGDGSPCLPPSKSARPSLSFKEMDAQHVSETIYFPSKPEWKPINLTLYDIKKDKNPVIEWIKKAYEVDENNSVWKPSSSKYVRSTNLGGSAVPQIYNTLKIGNCKLELYDGVGNIIEQWIIENVWPNSIEFGDLDYSSSEVTTVDLQLRYDRAYVIYI